MLEYYTKEQMDFIATEVGKKLKQVSSQVSEETSSESIKLKYESNEDTNTFTDTYKSAVESLKDLTIAPNIDSFLTSFNSAAGIFVNRFLNLIAESEVAIGNPNTGELNPKFFYTMIVNGVAYNDQSPIQSLIEYNEINPIPEVKVNLDASGYLVIGTNNLGQGDIQIELIPTEEQKLSAISIYRGSGEILENGSILFIIKDNMSL